MTFEAPVIYGNSHAYTNEAIFQAILDERAALIAGVRRLFAANNVDEDRAARDGLRRVLSGALLREQRGAA